jgi:hypothetical protein
MLFLLGSYEAIRNCPRIIDKAEILVVVRLQWYLLSRGLMYGGWARQDFFESEEEESGSEV